MNPGVVLIWLDALAPSFLAIAALGMRRPGWNKDYLFWFAVTQAILNGTAVVLDQVWDANNLYLYHINCILSFSILSMYFRQLLNLKKINLIITGTLLAFFLFFTGNTIWWESLDTFNSNSLGVASFILIVYCFLYYLEQILRPTTISITRSKDFWYVTAIFTYYAGNFIIFISFNWLTQQHVKLDLIWKTHNVILFIMCLYIFIGFLCKPTQRT